MPGLGHLLDDRLAGDGGAAGRAEGDAGDRRRGADGDDERDVEGGGTVGGGRGGGRRGGGRGGVVTIVGGAAGAGGAARASWRLERVPLRRPGAVDAAGRAGFEVEAEVDQAGVEGEIGGGDAVIGLEIAAAEMERHHPAGARLDHRRAGIAAQRRAVVGERLDLLAEAGDGAAREQLAGLEALDVEQIAEDAALDLDVVAARIEGGIADDDDVEVGGAGGVAVARQGERADRDRDALDPQQRHVPPGVDDQRLGDPVEVVAAAQRLLGEVDLAATGPA